MLMLQTTLSCCKVCKLKLMRCAWAVTLVWQHRVPNSKFCVKLQHLQLQVPSRSQGYEHLSMLVTLGGFCVTLTLLAPLCPPHPTGSTELCKGVPLSQLRRSVVWQPGAQVGSQWARAEVSEALKALLVCPVSVWLNRA